MDCVTEILDHIKLRLSIETLCKIALSVASRRREIQRQKDIESRSASGTCEEQNSSRYLFLTYTIHSRRNKRREEAGGD